MSDDQDYQLYVLLCDEHVLYTGIAIDPHARLKQHQSGHPHGAKFTRRFDQLEIIYQVKVGTRATAQSLEIKFKKLNRQQKLMLIKKQPSFDELKDYLDKLIN